MFEVFALNKIVDELIEKMNILRADLARFCTALIG